MTNQTIKTALEARINNWYENARIDYGVSGRFLDVETYGDKGQHLYILWEEEGKRYKMPVSWWTEYNAEQVYNIWMEFAGDEDTEELPPEPNAEDPAPKQINTVKHEEYTLKGRRVILDTAELFPGNYETMLLRRSDGHEIASMRAATEAEALAHFSAIRAAYPPDKPKAKRAPGALTGRYAKLRDDLKKALEVGRAAEDANPEDGGTCNFDSAALSLPRWTAEKVKQAAKEAGTSCFVWNCYGSKQFVFGPNTRAQGNARSRNAEAMTRALRSMGYDAMDYCQMD